MSSLCLKRFLNVFVAVLYLGASTGSLLSNPALAQSDSEPPEITVEAVDEGARGDLQVFSATVTDNEQLANVTLYYRLGDDAQYTAAEMSAIASTSIYTASVDTGSSTVDVIQYYVEARDTGGNRSVEGFAFDPLQRLLVDASEVVEPVAEVEAPSTSLPMSRKIIYGVLGVVVLGALASAGGGGGGGGGGDTSELTIFADPITK